MPKNHIFLQNGSSTLDDISLQNVIAHPADFFKCSITASLSYKNFQKKLDGLIEWVGPSKLLQNEHFKTYNFAFWVSCYKMPRLGGFL